MRPVSALSLGFILLLAAGCKLPHGDGNDCTADDSCDGGAGGTAQSLVAGGVLLQSVDNDRAWMAYLQNPRAAAVTSGNLLVAPLSNPAAPHLLAQNALAASMSTDARLFFLVNPQASIDAGSSATYGRLAFWMPSMAAAAQLSTGDAVIRAIGPGNSYALFWDQAAPTTATAGDVRLALAADCSVTTCAVTTLLPAVGGVATTAVSSDGRFAAFTVRQGGSGHGYDAYLVDVFGGTLARVVSGGSGDSIGFSSDGALFAAVGPGGALRVFDSASHAEVRWSALPAPASVVQVAFSDPGTLVLRATAPGSKQADAWVTTATSAKPLASGINALAIFRSTTSGGRWAVLSHDYAGGVGALEAYDLTGATPAPIAVAASSSYATLSLSPDGRYLRALDSYDPVAAAGDLTVVSLPGARSATIASGIALAAPSFLGDAHELAYLDANGALTVWNDVASTALADGVVDWRARGSSATLYFTVGDGGDSIHGYAPGIYSQRAP